MITGFFFKEVKEMNYNDTICSIVTGIGPAAVSIIKVSGEEAVEIVDKIWQGKKKLSQMDSHQVQLGKIYDNFSGQLVDQCLCLPMRAPRSYTGEDVVEIQSHGSFIAVNYILELLIKNGARHAQAGEFSKRAFLNGKMDLTEAEAIIDIIEAKNKQGLKFAADSLAGKNSHTLETILSDLIELLAYMEASIDFPEDDLPPLDKEEKEERIRKISLKIEELLLKSEKSKYINDGIRILIIGQPNVGKSSFLNMLLDEERAIVSDIPGTTRDTVEEYLTIGKIPAKIIDTAGIRKSQDAIEKLGIEKSKEGIDKADLIIYMIDLSQPYQEEKDEIYPLIKDKEKIILLNKIDTLKDEKDLLRVQSIFSQEKIFPFSTMEKKHLDILEKEIENTFIDSDYDFNEGVFITNSRQKGLLQKALLSLKQALDSLEMDMEDDFVTIDLYDAKVALEETSGKNISEDVMDAVFSKFCIGK